jgi:predicted Fe-Mo cluster-binding NifX family protein
MRIGVPLVVLDLDAAPPERLEDAQWVLIHDGKRRCTIVRNTAQSASDLADIFSAHRCTDVVMVYSPPPAAVARMRSAGIRVWTARPATSARDLVRSVRALPTCRMELNALAERGTAMALDPSSGGVPRPPPAPPSSRRGRG